MDMLGLTEGALSRHRDVDSVSVGLYAHTVDLNDILQSVHLFYRLCLSSIKHSICRRKNNE